MKNFVVRTITGILFVAVMVVGICFRGDAMILLFAFITGLTLWEYTGLVSSAYRTGGRENSAPVRRVYLVLFSSPSSICLRSLERYTFGSRMIASRCRSCREGRHQGRHSMPARRNTAAVSDTR